MINILPIELISLLTHLPPVDRRRQHSQPGPCNIHLFSRY